MGGIANAVGGVFQGVGQAFTPQNNYSANTAGQNYNSLLAGTQQNLGNDQSNEQSLANQLLAQSQGQGPNPAQIQLQQALNQNQQNAAGQVASQKGINPGLAQKQIENNSANMSQQAAGQGALMGAQQQLAAQGQLSGVYNNMANQNNATQGQYENALTGNNSTNASTSAQNAAANQNTTGGLLQAAGPAMGVLGGLFHYKGGEIKKYASGGNVLGTSFGGGDTSPSISLGLDDFPSSSAPAWGTGLSEGMAPLSGDPTSSVGSALGGAGGKLLSGMGKGGGDSASSAIANQLAQQAGEQHWAAGNAPKNSGGVDPAQIATMAAMFAHGGPVPIMHPNHPVMMALKAQGGKVPGPEIVPGDSPKNDVVPAVLSAKEIVLPKSVTQSDNAGDMAKSFVEQIKGKSSKDGGYAKVIAAKRKALK